MHHKQQSNFSHTLLPLHYITLHYSRMKPILVSFLVVAVPILLWTLRLQIGAMLDVRSKLTNRAAALATRTATKGGRVSSNTTSDPTGRIPVEVNATHHLNKSIILGQHMESIELLPLDDWQKDTIQKVAEHWNKKKTERNNSGICHPPSTHISTQFCCGGITSRLRDKTFKNDPFACAVRTEADHERVREIALKYMTPLPETTTTNKCDVCQIVETMWSQKLTMHFLGDSVTHQMTYGWICALQQRNYQVTTTMLPNDGTAFYMHISSPNWKETHANGTATEGAIHMLFLNAMRFPNKLKEWDALGNVDILVANYGIHWAYNATHKSKTPETYAAQMNRTFSYWTDMQKDGKKLPRVVAMRETSGQHFGADSGEYFWYYKQPNRTDTCVPNPQTTVVGWRERIVTAAAKANGFEVHIADETLATTPTNRKEQHQELIWLPYMKFTSELHFFHPFYIGGVLDCSHFCQSPYLWWPVWRSLRLAVDREFG
jgi:hypothetical protein